MESIGVRALKQNASAVIERVDNGETIRITNRGRPVAQIVPLRGDRYQELVDAGVITPPSHSLDDFFAWRELHRADMQARGVPTGNLSGLTTQQILDEQRAERL